METVDVTFRPLGRAKYCEGNAESPWDGSSCTPLGRVLAGPHVKWLAGPSSRGRRSQRVDRHGGAARQRLGPSSFHWLLVERLHRPVRVTEMGEIGICVERLVTIN